MSASGAAVTLGYPRHLRVECKRSNYHMLTSDRIFRSEVVFVGHPVLPVGDCLGSGFVGADELQLRERDAQ